MGAKRPTQTDAEGKNGGEAEHLRATEAEARDGTLAPEPGEIEGGGLLARRGDRGAGEPDRGVEPGGLFGRGGILREPGFEQSGDLGREFAKGAVGQKGGEVFSFHAAVD